MLLLTRYGLSPRWSMLSLLLHSSNILENFYAIHLWIVAEDLGVDFRRSYDFFFSVGFQSSNNFENAWPK